jgi:hypothetical protein
MALGNTMHNSVREQIDNKKFLTFNELGLFV